MKYKKDMYVIKMLLKKKKPTKKSKPKWKQKAAPKPWTPNQKILEYEPVKKSI